MNTFGQYVTDHKIDQAVLCSAAKVRYMIVWNAVKGNPITPENATKLKEAALKLTGVPYNGAFALLPTQSSAHQLPVIPVKQLPFHVRQTTPTTRRSYRSGTGS